MDPIKVDFSGGGKKKGNTVVIPPNKAGLKIAINIIGTVIIAAIAYYFYLPAFNFQAIEMYIYLGMIILAYCVMSFITSGAIVSPEYSPYARKRVKIPLIIGLAIAVIVGIGFAASSVFFRAKDYHEIIAVNDQADFSAEIVEVDFSNVPLLDKESAETLATKALSDLFDQNLVSQFDVNSCETQINLNQKPVRVATLKYDNIIKWFNNRKAGLPGYLVIDMNTQKVNYKEVQGGIRYSDADHFNHLLKRHLRFKYPTKLLGDSVLEVDEQGKAWWVCPVYKNTIGLFGGRDVVGAILVDPTTGDCQEYKIDQIRNDAELKWLDRVYDPELLVEQYDYYGKYVGGFWNSVLGQDNVVITTDGYNYIALNDDVYMYTGVTSITAGDNSITGFTLINQRTKEAKFYRVSGATENAAQEAAQGKVQQYSYTATFPLLVNIGDEPTYFMALKDNSNIVQQYALVNVNQFTTIIATDTTIEGCRKAYIKLLNENNIDVAPDAGQAPDTEDEGPQVTTATGNIAEIRIPVIDGNSCYFIKLDSGDTWFTVYANEFEQAVIADVGNSVEITYKESEEDIIEAESFTLK